MHNHSRRRGWTSPVAASARRVARVALALAVTTSVGARRVQAQMNVDSGLAAYIATIRAVDHHAHPMLPVLPSGPADTDFDALPLDDIPAFPLPSRLLPSGNSEWWEAARRMYGLGPADSGEAIAAARRRVMAEQGKRFPAWALDQAGIDVMFANRITVGAGLAEPRFRWVPFADPLLFPLDVRGEADRTPDTRSLYPKEAALLQRYTRDLDLDELPGTLDEYVRRVITPTLEQWSDKRAVGVKFEIAYLRALDFDDPDSAGAGQVYARYVRGGTPSHVEYKRLEDYLFRVIAREAGRLRLAVHLHVFEGFGGFYGVGGSRPELLEPAVNDPTLRATTFVIVHGGWPATGETEAMLSKPNVYADISMMDLALSPTELAEVLHHWLSRWPDKVLFGSDAFDGGDQQGWELGAAVASHTARQALGVVLTGMLRDGEVTRDRAKELARMVLRENAWRLYRLAEP